MSWLKRLMLGTPESKKDSGPIPTAVADSAYEKTATGLDYYDVKAGTGASPTKDAMVTFHYSGWLTSGKRFDSSVVEGQAVPFRCRSPQGNQGLRRRGDVDKSRRRAPVEGPAGSRRRRSGRPAGHTRERHPHFRNRTPRNRLGARVRIDERAVLLEWPPLCGELD